MEKLWVFAGFVVFCSCIIFAGNEATIERGVRQSSSQGVQPGDNETFTCTIPSLAHRWESLSLRIARSLTAADRGVVIPDPPVQFAVIEVIPGTSITSTVTLTATANLNGTDFLCRDGFQELPDPQSYILIVTASTESSNMTTPSESPEPTTDAVDCGVPAPPGNGSIVNYTSTLEGSAVFYRCNSGFGPLGEMTAVCAANGSWSPDPADVTCLVSSVSPEVSSNQSEWWIIVVLLVAVTVFYCGLRPGVVAVVCQLRKWWSSQTRCESPSPSLPMMESSSDPSSSTSPKQLDEHMEAFKKKLKSGTATFHRPSGCQAERQSQVISEEDGDQLPDSSSEFVTQRYARRTQRHQFTERSEGTNVLNQQEEGKASDTYHFASLRESPVLVGPELSSPKLQIATASIQVSSTQATEYQGSEEMVH